MNCYHCNIEGAEYEAPITGEPLCIDCLETLLRQEYLREMEPEDWRVLRRRIEDDLRKRPGDLLRVAAYMCAREMVQFEDLI